MIAISWSSVIFGLVVGALASACFFAGLGLGMRRALRAQSPIAILLCSAALRITLLLWAGWAAAQHAGTWGALGFAAAFLIIRFGVTRMSAAAGEQAQ